MKPEDAKLIWSKIQDEMFTAQSIVDKKLRELSNPKDFFQFLCKNQSSLNTLDAEFFDCKFGHYGKLIATRLLFPEKGRLYLETAYYPLKKPHYGRRRISISDKYVFTNHFMERLIERRNLHTLEAIKNEIDSTMQSASDSSFTQQIGGLDISTKFIIVSREAVLFGDLELENDIANAVMTTIITKNEYSTQKREMIDFILDSTKSDFCCLATHDLPKSEHEALNIIDDTKVRANGSNKPYIQNWIEKNTSPGRFNQDKKQIKAFIDYLDFHSRA